MSELLTRRLALLGAPEHLPLLTQSLHGIERETLRVDARGELARSAHPKVLGSALTHAQITTDYSEALLEFITPAEHDAAQTFADLSRIHRFVASRLGDELLWSPSMPGRLPVEAEIPIAEYGHSLIGQLKHVYRKGLALRYGKTMQCIAGIHYNFSLSEALWPLLHQAESPDDGRSARDYQSARYIALTRNFRRYSWLLMYLFGASPALDASFLRGREHNLEQLAEDTLYLPWATSLRMSDLGYQNNAQSSLTPCYDDLPSYVDSLRAAVATPYPPYAEIGTQRDGEWLQLNTNILQIENEYYSIIRPKRVARSGERPIQALSARGVQYVEVRCLDIDPFLPLGIELTSARFLDTFLLYCALHEAPPLADGACRASTDNFLAVVREGRRPELQLCGADGKPRSMVDWGQALLDEMAPIADLLDRAHGGDAHHQALQAQQAKLADASLTPSARVLAALRDGSGSFAEFALAQSRKHRQAFLEQPLDAASLAEFERLAEQSLEDQQTLERTQTGDFDAFVAAYQASILDTAPQPV